MDVLLGLSVAVVMIGGIVLRPAVALSLIALPLVIACDHAAWIPPLGSLADVDIRIYDVGIAVVGVKIGTAALVKKRALFWSSLHSWLVMLLSVLWLATFRAWFTTGREVFVSEAIALLRFSEQVLVFALLAQALTGERSMKHLRIVEIFGVAVAGSVYLETVGYLSGRDIWSGEMAAVTGRFFGVVGDQVTFVLLYFIFASLLSLKPLRASYFTGALIATGSRGGAVALAVGLGCIAWRLRHRVDPHVKQRVATAGILLAIGIAVVVGGGLGSFGRRWFGQELESSLLQRTRTASVAWTVVTSNPLFGSGYTGFRHVARDYGAEEAFSGDVGFVPSYIANAGNQYLQVLSDAGVVGLSVFLVTMSVLLKALGMPRGGRYNMIADPAYVWVLSLLLGNQAAVWLLPGSVISQLVFLLAASAVADVARKRRDHTAATVVSSPVRRRPSVPSIRPACVDRRLGLAQ